MGIKTRKISRQGYTVNITYPDSGKLFKLDIETDEDKRIENHVYTHIDEPTRLQLKQHLDKHTLPRIGEPAYHVHAIKNNGQHDEFMSIARLLEDYYANKVRYYWAKTTIFVVAELQK